MKLELMLTWYSVDDLERAKKFYGEMLGLKKTFEMPGWAEFAAAEGGASIGLNADPRAKGPSGVAVLRVADLDKARKELAARGVKFEGEVEEVPGVVRIGTFRDPAGNRLQLAQVLMGAGA
jgi:predicted enzyme related to lactoylglutathione lyase